MAKILIHISDAQTQMQLREALLHSGHKAVFLDSSGGNMQQMIMRFDLALFAFEDPRFDEYLYRASEAQAAVIVLVEAKQVEACARALLSPMADYVVCPPMAQELTARVDAMLRIREASHVDVLTVGDVQLIAAKRQVLKAGKPVKLMPREYAMLLFFMQNPGIVFTRDQLIESIWGDAGAATLYSDTRTVDMHVRRLRSKLDLGDAILTVQKIGYRLDDSMQGSDRDKGREGQSES